MVEVTHTHTHLHLIFLFQSVIVSHGNQSKKKFILSKSKFVIFNSILCTPLYFYYTNQTLSWVNFYPFPLLVNYLIQPLVANNYHPLMLLIEISQLSFYTILFHFCFTNNANQINKRRRLPSLYLHFLTVTA